MKKVTGYGCGRNREYTSTLDHAVLYKENKDGWTWREIERQISLSLEHKGYQVIKEEYGSYSGRNGYASTKTVLYGHRDNDLAAIGVLFHEWGHVVLKHNYRGNGYNHKDKISVITCEIQAWDKAYEKIKYFGFDIPEDIENERQRHMRWLADEYGKDLFEYTFQRLKKEVDK